MIAALVPVKALDQAKGRLASVLSEDERRRLALAMLEDVLAALRAVPSVDHVAVVSPDADALDRSEALGAEPIPEQPSSGGVNEALTQGAAVLAGRGATALLILAADIPTAASADLEALLEALPERGIALAPTSDRGTAALALRPPEAIAFQYGRDSSVLHERAAVARDLPARVLHFPSLARDVDGPDDLAHLMASPSETVTHRLLTELRIAERLTTPC